MKKGLFFGAIVLLTVIALAISGITLKDVFLWQGMYLNNPFIDLKTNVKIKTLTLRAVKDYCSALPGTNQDDIYDENSYEHIIQYDSSAACDKKLFCFINFDFMRTLEKSDQNEYRLIVTRYKFEEYNYYHITIKEIDGVFKIISFSVDI